MATLIYLIGLICSVWCVLDIFKKNNLSVVVKVIVSLAVLAFSWVGLAVYYFILRNRI